MFLISELLTLIIKIKSCPSTLSYIFYLRCKIVQKQMFNRLITQLGNSYFQEHAVKCHVETDLAPLVCFCDYKRFASLSPPIRDRSTTS